MRTEDARFFSDGHALAGSWFLPDASSAAPEPGPVVVACSGFTGLRHIHPARFARSLTARGLACFGFDYRGFAESEGPRCRVLLSEQARDILHAVAYCTGDERVDPRRIILLGWGMGAGLVVDAAGWLPDLAGLVCVNGFYDGLRVQTHHRGSAGLASFRRRVESERRARVRTGEAEHVDPFEIYPLDEVSRRYVDEVLRSTPGYEAERYSMELADSLLGWRPEARADRLRVPTLVAHGRENRLHPPDEAESLRRFLGGPSELFMLEDAGHTEFMDDDDPRYRRLAGVIGDWIEHRLAALPAED